MGAPRTTKAEAERRLAKLGKSDKVSITKWEGYNSRENKVRCHCGNEYKTSGRNLIGTDKPHPYSGCSVCIKANRPRPPAGGDWSKISKDWKNAIERRINNLKSAGRADSTLGQIRGRLKKICRDFTREDFSSPDLLSFDAVQKWYQNGPSAHEKSDMWALLFQENLGEYVVRLNGRVPKAYWANVDNRKKTLERMASELDPQWTNQEDWLDLKKEMIPHSGLADYYAENTDGGSVFDCVYDVFVDWKYHPWDFTHGPAPGHWQTKSNRLDALQRIEMLMGWTEPQDWYYLKEEHFDLINGRLRGFYGKHAGGKILAAVRDIYPKLLDEPWHFDRCPIDWVDQSGDLNIDLAKRWVEFIQKQLGFSDVTQLQSVLKKKHFEDPRYNGYGLYQVLVGSQRIPNLLAKTHPQHREIWNDWEVTIDSPLKDVDERRRRMGSIAAKYNINETKDWYSVGTSKAQAADFGSGLISFYGGWLSALEDYTGQRFYPWLFDGGMARWNDDLVSDWIEWVANEHGLPGINEISNDNEEEWLILNRDFLTKNGGTTLRKRYGTMWNLLDNLFPDYNFSKKFHDEFHNRTTSALERAMNSAIRQLFGFDEKDTRLKITQYECTMSRANLEAMGIDSDDLKFSPTDTAKKGVTMNVDSIIPMVKLAFEAQGQQHYYYNTKFHETEQDFRGQLRRDGEKASALSDVKIALVEVPYWWDYTAESLGKYILDQTGKSVDDWKRMLDYSTNLS